MHILLSNNIIPVLYAALASRCRHQVLVPPQRQTSEVCNHIKMASMRVACKRCYHIYNVCIAQLQ